MGNTRHEADPQLQSFDTRGNHDEQFAEVAELYLELKTDGGRKRKREKTRLPPPLPNGCRLIALLDVYENEISAGHPILHIPTLRARITRIAYSAQTDKDFADAGIPREVVYAVLWSSCRALGDTDGAQIFEELCMTGLADRIANLRLAELAESSSSPFDVQLDPVLEQHFMDFLLCALIAVLPMSASGRCAEIANLRRMANTAHRLARYGSHPMDQCSALPIVTGDGRIVTRWVTSRDPCDLAGWIATEERARMTAWLLTWDATSAELQGFRPVLVRGGYRLASGEIVPGSYGAVPLPCPDILFDALPASPMGPEDVASWLSTDVITRTSYDPLPYSQAALLPDLPLDSPERNELLENIYGNYLAAGFMRGATVTSVVNSRIAEYRDFCRSHGLPLNGPPTGSDKNEIRAKAMRDSLVLLFRDVWNHLPPQIGHAGFEGDGEVLWELSARHWGSRFDFALPQNMLNYHSAALTLYSPRELPTCLSTPLDVSALSWTRSPMFLVASSHAIAAARLAKSAPGTASARPISMLWPLMVLRAAWTRVVCLQSLKEAPTNAGPCLPGDPDAVAQKVVDDVGECLRSIERQKLAPEKKVDGKSCGRYADLVKAVVARLAIDGGVSQEEAEAVNMVRDL